MIGYGRFKKEKDLHTSYEQLLRVEDNPDWDVVKIVIGSYSFQLFLYN